MIELSKNMIKWIHSLQIKKVRENEGYFIVEGEKMVLELLEQKKLYTKFIVSTNSFEVNKLGIEQYIVSEKIFNQVSKLKTPNKVLAVVKIPEIKVPEVKQLVIALDNIQDPGNMGTIMRIADWFGIKDIICSTNTVDCFNPKVVQASMGAIFRVNVHYCNLTSYLAKQNIPIYGAFLEGKKIYHLDLSAKIPSILVMGNEGNGISDEIKELVTQQITIPKFGKAESLNVGIASGILVSEFFRKV